MRTSTLAQLFLEKINQLDTNDAEAVKAFIAAHPETHGCTCSGNCGEIAIHISKRLITSLKMNGTFDYVIAGEKIFNALIETPHNNDEQSRVLTVAIMMIDILFDDLIIAPSPEIAYSILCIIGDIRYEALHGCIRAEHKDLCTRPAYNRHYIINELTMAMIVFLV